MLIIGCGRALGGRPIQILATSPGSGGAGPCLRIVGLPGGTRGCGYAPSERVPPVTEAIGGEAAVRRGPGRPLELYGETTAAVSRITLSYRLPNGCTRHKRATLIRVRDRATLRAAKIRKPFGYFVAAVPAHARDVSAEARTRSGAVLDRSSFDRLAGNKLTDYFILTPSAGELARLRREP